MRVVWLARDALCTIMSVGHHALFVCHLLSGSGACAQEGKRDDVGGEGPSELQPEQLLYAAALELTLQLPGVAWPTIGCHPDVCCWLCSGRAVGGGDQARCRRWKEGHCCGRDEGAREAHHGGSQNM